MEKEITEFYVAASTKDRLCKQCKECVLKKRKNHWIENKEKIKPKREAFYSKNKENINRRRRDIRRENPEVHRKKNREWNKNNTDKKRAYSAQYKYNKKEATPSWLSKFDREYIRHLYIQANNLENITGDRYHVDHIVPLKGENVCGLHVPWNLDVITAEENMSKGNKLLLGGCV